MSGYDEEPDYEMEMKSQFDKLRAQRDDLLVACKAVLEYLTRYESMTTTEKLAVYPLVRDAVAKANGAP